MTERRRGHRVPEAISVRSVVLLWVMTRTNMVPHVSIQTGRIMGISFPKHATKNFLITKFLACNQLCIYAAVIDWFDMHILRREKQNHREGSVVGKRTRHGLGTKNIASRSDCVGRPTCTAENIGTREKTASASREAGFSAVVRK